ncbi:MAG TPA: cation:proton antiporter [Pyrinomonadaceae bacterium]|nr:cation:proton antiporter [Pyrinomonadaceae bacterium]
MTRSLGRLLLSIAIILLCAFPAFAAPSSDGHNQLNPIVLIGIAFVLLIGKVGGEIFERVRQPAVLGELVAGVVVGNLSLVGFYGIDPLKTDPIIAALAQIGVIILLFEVGLETNLSEMREVGWSSLLVAVTGVIVPFLLGWLVAGYFLPEESTLAHIFVGATLCATSIGITARVLRDLGKVKVRESRIILGAAVIDDVLGLLILAVISGAIQAATTGQRLTGTNIAVIAAKALAFLLAAIVAGHFLMPPLFKGVGRFKTGGVLLAFSIVFCFTLAWLAAIVGLAPIIGAFAAGLVLDEVHFKPFERGGKTSLEELLRPLSTVLVPIFFVLMGLRLDLRAFARADILAFAIVLTIVAIISKQACSLAVAERGLNRLAVGIGMIPRGEVGLIFAGIGTGLSLPNIYGANEPVINAATFGAIIVMVIITTLATPPVLKWALSRKRQKRQK